MCEGLIVQCGYIDMKVRWRIDISCETFETGFCGIVLLCLSRSLSKRPLSLSLSKRPLSLSLSLEMTSLSRNASLSLSLETTSLENPLETLSLSLSKFPLSVSLSSLFLCRSSLKRVSLCLNSYLCLSFIVSPF